LLHYPAKRVQHHHIDKQVHPVGMDEGVGQKTVGVFKMLDIVSIKDHTPENLMIIEGQQ
jgi:hypothetical protein